MSKQQQVKEIISSMMDFFDVDDFDDLDSLMQMDLVCEIEECLDINIPLSILDQTLTRRQFTEAVIGIYEDTI